MFGKYLVIFMSMFLILLSVMQLTQTSSASVLTSTTSTASFSVSDAAYTESNYPNTATGGQQNYYLGQDFINGQYNKGLTRLYMKFGFGPSSLPSGAVITNAWVYLYQYARSCTLNSTFHYIAYPVTSNWAGSSITWNNSPTLGGTIGNGSFACVSSEWKTLNITSLVQSWFAGGTNYGVSFWGNPESAAGVVFRSHTCSPSQCPGQEHPYLLVEYSVPSTPTPTTRPPTSTPTATPKPPTPTYTATPKPPTPTPNPYAQDKIAPSGQLTAPTNNITVGPGKLYIAAVAWDNTGGTGVNRVEFWVRYNNQWHKAKYDYSSPYSVNWTIPSGLSSQNIEIGIHIVDNAGNVAIDPGGKRTVYYVRPDTTKPDAYITAPTNGATVYPGSLRLKAEAWDNTGGSGVNRVEFWARYNGQWHNVKTEYVKPYDTSWNIPSSLSAQDIEIGLHVVDNAGNVAIDPGGTRTIHYRPFSYDKTKPDGRIISPKDNITVGPGKLRLEAQAWDNPGGSGVKRVEFWIKYDGSWHRVNDDYDSPYVYDWTIPSGLSSQKIEIGTHIIDNTGNMAIDPGGKRTVNYQRTVSWPAPYIHQLWSTDPTFNGGASCGPSSLGMLLAWYKKLTPRDPWGTKDGFKSPYSWYVTHGFAPFTTRKAPDASCKGAYAGLHGQCGVHTNCGYYSDWHRIGAGVKAMGLEIVMNGNYNYRNDLTKAKLIELVNSGRPTVIGTHLCGLGHIVLVRGYDSSSDQFIVSDPYGYCDGSRYDTSNKAYGVKYSWSRLRATGIYVKMKNARPGGVGMLLTWPQVPYDLMADATLTQTLLMLSETGEPEPFFSQFVVFDPQNGLLQTQLPEAIPSGIYDIAIKPPRSLMGMQSAVVYTTNLMLDFSVTAGNAFVLGDVDRMGGDNVLNVFDVATLFDYWGQSSAVSPDVQYADLNSDGIVNDNDLILLSEHYGVSGQGHSGVHLPSITNAGITLTLHPHTTTQAMGETFVVDIQLNAPTQTYGADVILRYNPLFLSVVDANPAIPGTQITSQSDVYPITQRNEVDLENGVIYFSSHAHPSNLLEAGGRLATVNFQTLAATQGTMLLFDFFPGFTNDSNVSVPGSAEDSLEAAQPAVIKIIGEDTLPPSGYFILNQGADYTNQTEIPFTLVVEDAYSELTESRVSLDGVIWGEWFTFTNEFIGNIPTGDGEKIVAVEVRDAASNTAVFTDSVILDTAPPTGEIRIVDVIDNRTLVYQISPDVVQEIDQMLISQDPSFTNADWISFIGENQVAPLEYGNTLYARLMDYAGNVSDIITSSVFLADFRSTPLCGIAPITVTFSDNSLGGPSSWHWNFGDGFVSSEQNPIHTYIIPGVYDVSLTVTGLNSFDVLTRTAHIHVTVDGVCNATELTIVNNGTVVTFEGDLDEFTLADGEVKTFSNLSVGSYSLFENTTQLVGQNWYLSGVDCEDQNRNWVPIMVDYETFQVDIDLQLSQNLTCVFTHGKEKGTSVYLPLVIRE